MNRKTILLLTSGGDSPGMNAAIRAVVRSAIANKVEVIGVKRGFEGLINGDFTPMNLRSVADIIHRGGTILYTSRSVNFKTESGLHKASQNCKKMGTDVVIIGGDGSFIGLKELSETGVNCIGIPATIDSDIACTDYTIGFDTAMNTAMQMVDRIRDTAQSNDKCNIVEVMGRKSGNIALRTGIGVGATAILVPEIECDISRDVIDRIKFTQSIGKKHFIVVVAEGTGKTREVAQKIKSELQIEAITTILGHVQRGGSPTLRDRIIASEMGCKAVSLVQNNQKNRIIAYKNGKIVDYDIRKALSMKQKFDFNLYNQALKISI